MKKNKLNYLIIIILMMLNSIGLRAQYDIVKDNRFFSLNTLQRENLITEKSLNSYDSQAKRGIFLKSDTSIISRIEYLRNDDPEFNRKYSFIIPAVDVIGFNILNWASDHYISKASYSDISLKTWKYNINNGWVWDDDRMAMNFLFHPTAGSYYFNCGRSNGYSFFTSLAFSFEGSLMWEYFGENTQPSIDDIINTTGNSTFLGEIIYRISSHILDDRTTGSERVLREIFAGIIDPVRGVNRLLQGKSYRVTTKEVYQKEPLSFTISGGEYLVNNGTRFGTGRSGQKLGIRLDYGDPFEDRSRKPYDVFNLRLAIGDGEGRKVLNRLTGYGLLFGKNTECGKMDMLVGAFQHYNFFDNKLFELYTMAISGGVMTRIQVSEDLDLYTNYHIGFVPFGGNNTQLGPEMTQVRDYNYCGGMETILESRLNFRNMLNFEFTGYYYWLHTYVGVPGIDYTRNNYIGLIKPSVSLRIYKNLSLGFEHLLYLSDRNGPATGKFHVRNSEQKICLLFYFGDFRQGKGID
jgi:hypothetical protein